MCNAKITQSTELSRWPTVEDSGGYKVHPVPEPDSIKKLFKRYTNENGNNQKDRLFNLGNAISVVPHIRGINQFPKPEISIGITVKKIITTACAVTIALKSA